MADFTEELNLDNAGDITNSPAYAFLDDMLSMGKLSETQVELLKAKYQRLHEVVIATYSNEKRLLHRARELQHLVEAERHKLEQRAVLSHETKDELSGLDKELNEQTEALDDAKDSANLLRYEREELRNTKKEHVALLEEKYKRGLEALEPVVAQLQGKIDEYKADVDAQLEAFTKENKASQDYQKMIEKANNVIISLEEDKLRCRAEYSEAMALPDAVRHAASTLNVVKQDLAKELESLQRELLMHEEELHALQAGRDAGREKIQELGNKLANFRVAIAKRKINLDEIRHAQDIERAKADEYQDRQMEIDGAFEEQKAFLRRANAEAANAQKVNETQKRLYERLRRKYDVMSSIIVPLKEQFERESARHDEMKIKGNLLTEVKEDEELFISQYLSREKLEEDTSDLLFAVDADRREYEAKITLLASEEKKFQLAIKAVCVQREMVTRSVSKLAVEQDRMMAELKVKSLLLSDLDKHLAESHEKIQNSAVRYEKMKTQRNRLANLTQSTALALAELNEKNKILQNEVDILRNESQARDKALSDEVRMHQQAQQLRDTLRQDQNKNQAKLCSKKEEEDQQLNEIERLNSVVDETEKHMIRLRKDYAGGVDHRNLAGILVIDRNDELCILYEKSNIQRSILKKGKEEMARREAEAAALVREIQECQRQIEVRRRKIPSLTAYSDLARKLQSIEKQLSSDRSLTEVLCASLQDPSSVRKAEEAAAGLRSTDPDAAKLIASRAVAASAALTSSVDELALSAHSNSGGGGRAAGFSTGAPGGGKVAGKDGRGRGNSSSRSHQAAMEGKEHMKRFTKLKGMDPEPAQLQAKIEVLQGRLNHKKEKLLEKELVLDEVTSLGDKLRVQAAETRSYTLNVAQKVNDYQARIRTATRKIMATVSELSMYQATAMKLEQERAAKQEAYNRARERMARDLPPTEDAEHEWFRIERDYMVRKDALLEKSRLDMALQEEYERGGGTRTTAEPRPNAYIAEDLGIPRPYGGNAPFRPTASGANLRHFHVPQVPDVVI